jgi:hypothetical protein
VRLLCSTDVTPLHRYYQPLRHPLAFDPLPGVAGYKVYLSPGAFSLGRGGLLQLLSVSLSPCCRYHPTGESCRSNQSATVLAAFAIPVAGSASGAITFGATYAFTCVTAW